MWVRRDLGHRRRKKKRVQEREKWWGRKKRKKKRKRKKVGGDVWNGVEEKKQNESAGQHIWVSNYECVSWIEKAGSVIRELIDEMITCEWTCLMTYLVCEWEWEYHRLVLCLAGLMKLILPGMDVGTLGDLVQQHSICSSLIVWFVLWVFYFLMRNFYIQLNCLLHFVWCCIVG
jgi:hypothetical protein